MAQAIKNKMVHFLPVDMRINVKIDPIHAMLEALTSKAACHLKNKIPKLDQKLSTNIRMTKQLASITNAYPRSTDGFLERRLRAMFK